MKSVLISIRPKWCAKILSGEKTVEIRRTRPRLEPPFRCYLYCTLQGAPEFFRETLGGDVAKWNRGKWAERKGNVIGEFTCDEIIAFPAYSVAQACYALFARMAPDEIHKYLGNKDGYGWHISNLKIYDKPRELKEFRYVCREKLYCESCAMHRENEESCGNEALHLSRAPQSWCYVEESI